MLSERRARPIRQREALVLCWETQRSGSEGLFASEVVYVYSESIQSFANGLFRHAALGQLPGHLRGIDGTYRRVGYGAGYFLVSGSLV